MTPIEYLLQFSAADWTTTVLMFFLIIFAIVELVKALRYLMDWTGFESKGSKRLAQNESEIEELRLEVAQYKDNRIHDREQSLQIQKELLDNIATLRQANMVALGDRINQRYKYYLRIKGIPEDEFDEFVAMHDAYNALDGNHSGDAKFNQAMTFRLITEEERINAEHQGGSL